MGFMCLSGCFWKPCLSGFYSLWIHCAARKPEGPSPQMVSTDEQLKLGFMLHVDMFVPTLVSREKKFQYEDEAPAN